MVEVERFEKHQTSLLGFSTVGVLLTDYSGRDGYPGGIAPLIQCSLGEFT